MGVSIRELEATLDKLELQLNKEQEDNKTLRTFMQKASSETEEMVKKFRAFCCKILEKDLTSGELSTNDLQSMSLAELLKAAENSYKKEQDKNQEHFRRFADKLQEKKLVVDGLTAQVSHLQMKLSRCEDTSNLDDPSDDPTIQTASIDISGGQDNAPFKAVTNTKKVEKDTKVDSFASAVVTETSEDQISQHKKKKTESEDESLSEATMVINDIRMLDKNMDKIGWAIFKAIGEDGLSEFSEIEATVIKKWPDKKKPSLTAMRQRINTLHQAGLVEQMKVHTGFRWFIIHKLTVNGELLFSKHFRKKPVVPEMEVLRTEHDNYIHGYAIKDAAAILQKHYTFDSISTDRKKNYIKVSEDKASIPDVICTKDNSSVYFEVECGNHTNDDFNSKCDKLMMITNNLYFIGTKPEAIKTLCKQIEGWIAYRGGREALRQSNVTVYLTSHMLLKAHKSQFVFTSETEQPLEAQPINTLPCKEDK